MGGDLVITNLDKRIQLALYGDDMISYLQDKYKWTKSETDSINFKDISLAKARLPHASSICVSKMMHEWLNVGHQKEQISGSATDALCPCCGLQHEDQNHMFRCPSASVRNTINQGLKTMTKVFCKDNIPSGIARTFLNKVSKATADPSPQVPVQCPEAGIACKAQDRLGAMAILRGHHHKQWYYAISKTYKKRTHPLAKMKRRQKRTSPLWNSARPYSVKCGVSSRRYGRTGTTACTTPPASLYLTSTTD